MDKKLTISCDASIKENPGGDASAAAVCEGFEKVEKLPTEVDTINQAEYAAVLLAVRHAWEQRDKLLELGCRVSIVSDSQLVVKQLNGEFQVKDHRLAALWYPTVTEYIRLLREKGVVVEVIWLPRCSTPDLKKANDLAQEALGVKKH